jgi:hypothetical protein
VTVGALPLFLPGPPLDVGRDEAQSAARDELSRRIYHADDPPLLYRLLDKVWGWLGDALGRAAEASPGGALGLVLLIIAAVVLLVVLRWRVGPMGRAAQRRALFSDEPLDADGHRRLAEQQAADGDYAEAVRERLRAIVRELEQRGILEPRPGRTADEAAADAAAVVPELADDLRRVARIFDDIWYGGRTATPDHYADTRAVDDHVRAVRVRAAAVPASVSWR